MRKIKEIKYEILFNEKIKEAEFEKLSKAKEEVAKIEDKIAKLDYKNEELQKQISNIKELKKQGIDVDNLEDKNKILNELILEKIKNGTEDTTYLNVIDEWGVDKKYLIDDIVKKSDKIYYSNIEHVSSYETIPGNDQETWREKLVKDHSKSEELNTYENLEKKAKFYDRDVTYKLNDYVIYYNKLYKSLKDNNTSNPENDRKAWELILKPKHK